MQISRQIFWVSHCKNAFQVNICCDYKTFLQTLFVHCSKNSTSLSFVSSLWLQQGFVTFSLLFLPFLEFNLICILSVLSDYFTFWTIKCVPEDWEDVAKLWQQHSMTKWQNFTQHSKKSLFLNLQLSYKKVSFLHRFYKILFLTQIPTLGVNVEQCWHNVAVCVKSEECLPILDKIVFREPIQRGSTIATIHHL